MQYEPISEKKPVAPMLMSRPANNQDFKQNGDIRKARRIIFILLGIKLLLVLFYLIARIVSLIQFYRTTAELRDDRLAGSYIGNVIASIISVVYLIVFFVVVAKYLRLGILIFAWLGVIDLICVLIVVILSIIAIVAVSASKKSAGTGIVISILVVVMAAISCILTVLLVIFSFKLAKLIKQQEAYHSV